MSDTFDHGVEALDRFLDGEDGPTTYTLGLNQKAKRFGLEKTCMYCKETKLKWALHPNGSYYLQDKHNEWHFCQNNLAQDKKILHPVNLQQEQARRIYPMDQKFVSVTFERSGKFEAPSKEYTYMTDLDLVEGDRVVVEANDEYKVVTVVSVRGLTANQRSRATKWVVCKVDISAHEERLRKAAIAQEIRNKLQERRSQYEELQIYRQLAAHDPEIAKLMQELEQVDPYAILKLPAGESDPRD